MLHGTAMDLCLAPTGTHEGVTLPTQSAGEIIDAGSPRDSGALRDDLLDSVDEVALGCRGTNRGGCTDRSSIGLSNHEDQCLGEQDARWHPLNHPEAGSSPDAVDGAAAQP